MLVRTDGSERASWGLVDDDTCNAQAGVEVPIPTPILSPPFGLTLKKELVEVANLELAPPPPPVASVPQITFPFESVSSASVQLTIVDMANP